METRRWLEYFSSNYNLLLVATSYFLSIAGSFVALIFMRQALQKKQGKSRFLTLLPAAIALGGVGIWSMHFIGMLAYGNENLHYDALLTFASLIAAVVVVLGGFCLVSLGQFSYFKLVSAGLVVGTGVAAMHYLGMTAIKAKITYDPTLVQISFVIAVTAATVALWLACHVSKIWQMAISAIVMGIAVCGMHYTAMAAASLVDQRVSNISLLDNITLACIIVVVDTCFLSLMGFVAWAVQDRNRKYIPSEEPVPV